MPPWPPEFTAHGQYASLVPLAPEHGPDLAQAAADGNLSELWYTTIPTPEGIPAEIERRLALRATGSMLPFAVIDRHRDTPIGMTTYMHIDATNRRVEIGSTWLAAAAHRSPINTECKRMLLAQAFEVLDCIAVEFRTHFMNQQSRRAIERLGAKLDGVLRAHLVMKNGSLRDTAVYSITAPEWPAVRANLDHKLSRQA